MSQQQLADYFGKGITPQQFIDNMTVNKESFQDWYDRFEWKREDDLEFFRSFQFRDDVRCLIIAADWCGDVVRHVPVVFKALEETGIPVDVLIKEENEELMEQFLTMGGKSIPVVLFTDTGGSLLGRWGPRPEAAQSLMRAFKQENPDRDAPDYRDKIKKVYAGMVEVYGEDTHYHQLVLDELRAILSGV